MYSRQSEKDPELFIYKLRLYVERNFPESESAVRGSQKNKNIKELEDERSKLVFCLGSLFKSKKMKAVYQKKEQKAKIDMFANLLVNYSNKLLHKAF